MTKHRTQIPNDLAFDVMFAADRTCCICEDISRGRSVQIHHIDKDPSNNTFENLAVLCLQCHSEAHVRGGFGRKLTPTDIKNHKDKWLKNIAFRRKSAKEMAISGRVGEFSMGQQIGAKSRVKFQKTPVKDYPDAYINSLPDFRLALLRETRRQREELGESTLTIVQTNTGYIDALTGILVTLAADYYVPECFGNQSPQEFFSEIISSRYRLYSIIAEPDGPGTGGTIVPIRKQSSLIADVEKLVEILVEGNWEERYSEYEDWQKRWRSEEI